MVVQCPKCKSKNIQHVQGWKNHICRKCGWNEFKERNGEYKTIEVIGKVYIPFGIGGRCDIRDLENEIDEQLHDKLIDLEDKTVYIRIQVIE